MVNNMLKANDMKSAAKVKPPTRSVNTRAIASFGKE